MADMQKIHAFAVKWCDKFRDQKINYIELVDHLMADDCAVLGFEMDCGNAFAEMYGNAVHNYEALDKIIDEVNDIALLGSAIYSRWRYFNHWAYTGEEILEFENRSWFILALSRLAMLTGKNPDKVNRITIDYHRVTKIKPKQPISETAEYVTWNYSERLVVDREIETIEHIQNIGTGCIVSRKYKVEGGIEGLLDDLDADRLFDNIVGNPPDVIETPNETKDYTITIDFMKNQQRIIQGTYDKNGLPDDWAEFAESIFGFMKFYGFGEILDPSVYNKAKRHKEEYIYCSVIFEEGYKTYYYISDDDSIEVGDFVLVPAGKDNHTAIVEVVDIEYFSEEDASLPVEKTKHIIRKCTNDDFDLLEES